MSRLARRLAEMTAQAEARGTPVPRAVWKAEEPKEFTKAKWKEFDPPEHKPRKPAAATVRELKEADDDYEWYPTTDEIIDTVCRDMDAEDFAYHSLKSVLDVGAGDGRVLQAMMERSTELRKLYAIEKSITHLGNMPKGVTVVGTDLMEQSLLDKSASVTFCNPPYSEYAAWMQKIIGESTSDVLYFVVPRRWRDKKELACMIEDRNGEVVSLGEFDFEDADREARAKVETVRVRLRGSKTQFDRVVETMLPELDQFNHDEELREPEAERRDELAEGSENLVQSLVRAYDSDMAAMIEDYRAACLIRHRVLIQLGIEKSTIVNGIRDAVKTLKDQYWKTLFENLDEVTKRLATQQRAAFLASIQSSMTIDFTEGNVYAFLIWVSKWANDYYDEQLIQLFRTLSCDSNVVKYKSNQRVWTQGDWYYQRDDQNKASHYRLEYRMVISHGGICDSEWSYQKEQHHGLTEGAFNLLRDVVTVANNLGFLCSDTPASYEWESNKQHKIKLDDGKTLVAVRAFKNGNMHFHFNPSVMLAINVEAGRLLGWIRTPKQAAEEFKATKTDAKAIANLFGSSFRLSRDAGLNLELKD